MQDIRILTVYKKLHTSVIIFSNQRCMLSWPSDIYKGTQRTIILVVVIVQLLSRIWFFCDPWTRAHQAPLSMEFPRQKYWNGLPFPSPGDLLDLEIESESPALQADSLPLSHLGNSLIQLKPHSSFMQLLTLSSKKNTRAYEMKNICLVIQP